MIDLEPCYRLLFYISTYSFASDMLTSVDNILQGIKEYSKQITI
jgi:hypothetical protein